MKKILFKAIVILLCTIPFYGFSQKIEGILYKANKWADLTEYKSWTIAMDNPKYGNIGIFITDKELKLIRDKTVQTYVITKKTDVPKELATYFKVIYNNKTYDLKVYEIETSTYFKMDGLWMIEFDNKNRQTIYAK